MTLQDHFRPPLSTRRHWHAFHNAWATYIAADLNRRLPEGFFAEPNVQFGVEIDVTTFEEIDLRDSAGRGRSAGPEDAAAAWRPGPPARVLPISLLDDVSEVLLFKQEGGPELAAAIELVSPSNKDRPERREAFVTKCAAYLQQGLTLVVVDVVTDRRANLHRDLLAQVHPVRADVLSSELYATAYRPVRRAGETMLEIWEEPLALGRALPTMPLWLPGDLVLPLDLDGTYERTCREQRLRPAP